jgi:nucleotide-binding universal stress UspA family protein
MKILIAYDGSSHADAAVADLARAGMPQSGTARLLTVADVVMPPAYPSRLVVGHPEPPSLRDAPPHATGLVAKALETARKGAERVKTALPGWTIEAITLADAPAWGIIRESDSWQPDLVVVGSHGRGAVARFVMGSVSHKVLTEGRCNVRVSRPRAARNAPPRIIIAVDGSAGSDAAVAAVAARAWPPGTQVLLLCVFESRMAIAPPHAFDEERARSQSTLERAAAQLKAANPRVAVTTLLGEGEPAPFIVDQAEKWYADCVFLGARGLGAMERMLLGSVSTAVSMRAPCSVELVQDSETGFGAA